MEQRRSIYRSQRGGRWSTGRIRKEEEKIMWMGGTVVGIPVRWRVEDRKRLKEKYKIGQKIRIIKTEIEPATPV